MRETSVIAECSPDTTLAEADPAGKVRSSDLMRALAQVEHTFPTQEWRVAGIPIWPLVRLRWFFSEWAAQYTDQAGAAAPASAARQLRRMACGAAAAWQARWRDRVANDHGPARRDIVFLSDGISFSKLGGRYVERFCDPLIRAAVKRGLTTALWTPLHAYHQPRHTASCLIQPGVDRSNLRGALRARTGSAKCGVSLPQREQIVGWMRRRGFGVAGLQASKVMEDGCRIRSVANFHRRSLQRLQPRLAFVVSYYSVEQMGFVLACRESGIPVVDIQHGVQGELHPAYGALPPPPRGCHILLPDRFWVWSEWEAAAIARWSAGTRHAAIVGGDPWMRIWQPDSSWDGVSDAITMAAGLRRVAATRPVVLVTLQYGLSTAEQLDPLVRLLRACGERFRFWIRIHPLMLQSRAEIRAALAVACVAFELDLTTDLPLPALLMNCDVHLTHSSTTVIDAARFGVGSVVTAAYGAELFESLSHSGLLSVATGATAQIASELDRMSVNRAGRLPESAPLSDALDTLLADARQTQERRA